MRYSGGMLAMLANASHASVYSSQRFASVRASLVSKRGVPSGVTWISECSGGGGAGTTRACGKVARTRPAINTTNARSPPCNDAVSRSTRACGEHMPTRSTETSAGNSLVREKTAARTRLPLSARRKQYRASSSVS